MKSTMVVRNVGRSPVYVKGICVNGKEVKEVPLGMAEWYQTWRTRLAIVEKPKVKEVKKEETKKEPKKRRASRRRSRRKRKSKPVVEAVKVEEAGEETTNGDINGTSRPLVF